jgi:glucokinase
MASTTLLADIGGTNARFAILEGGKVDCFSHMRVADFADPLAAMQAFLVREGRGRVPTKAAIAAAGPVLGGGVKLTNSPWVIDGDAIGRALNLVSVSVVNDFTAIVESLPVLPASALRAIGGARPANPGPRLVIGPGTGFGVGALVPGRHEENDIVSEGGHATLAAENHREDAIIQLLRKDSAHVSVEHVLSGGGLVRLYRAVGHVDGLAAPDREPPDIVEHALVGDCSASRATLELFCAWLGSVAGDIGLMFGAEGGVYIAGGVVRHFSDFLARSAFRDRFEAKGRMKRYLAAIPVAVVLDPQPAFLGLARMVQRLSED